MPSNTMTRKKTAETTPLLLQHRHSDVLRSGTRPSKSLPSLCRLDPPTGMIVILVLMIAVVFELFCQSIALGLDICFDALIETISNTPKASTDNIKTTNNDYQSVGSAFSAIFLLQLSCVIQPAGSFTLQGALSTWRFSPVYCAIEAVLTLVYFYDAAISKKMSTISTALAIGAVRHRSYRPMPRQFVIIEQDIEDVQRLMRRRRIFAALNGILVIFQFVKVVSINGSPSSTITTYILGGTYFVYWAVNELLAEIIRFSRHETLDLCADDHEISALYNSQLATLDRITPAFPFMAGLLHIGTSIMLTIIVFGIGNGGLQVLGHHIPPIANHFLELGLLLFPILAIYFCLWPLLLPTQDRQHQFASHAWYSLQGLQSCVLILLYYLCMYDSTKVSRPSWLDWLGKV